MKKILLFIVAGLSWEMGLAQFRPVDQGSSIKFTIQNFGFDVDGSFSGLRGMVNFDPQNPANAHFDVDIDANTINTGNDLRDNHLRGSSYFDVKKYPRIQIVSAKISPGDKKGVFLFAGKLTIKGTTKDISFPFEALPSGEGYLFKGSFKINRKDFQVGGTSTISDNLEVQLKIVAQKEPAPAK
ncbi:YceI family protein [Mucilaginibacter ginsenosidivorans]|uniref:YceI family protein n=1 Tax=Mucilaginibacter ginsenosidivorans TaxID=398053 RepID=A0A5B8V0N8_9SPHI|nr:YceI family protein [Mucilaginibacter ginsenosidivorans]QEC64914.1 YceI family protein [Mucilaginibacter ginsenosidivorans]